jgi:hypothetical protein
MKVQDTPQVLCLSESLLGILGLIILLSSCTLLKPKSIGYDAAARIESRIDSLSNAETIERLTKHAVEGAIQGLATDASEGEISKFSIALSETLGKELNKVFSSLDTRSPGIKFSKGITDSLLNKTLELRLKAFVNSAVSSADGDLKVAISNIESNLTHSLDEVFSTLRYNISSLEKTLMDAMSQKLKDSLSYFLTDAISGIEFDSVSSHLSTELLSRELRDTLGNMVLEISKKITINDQVESWGQWVKENFIYGALFISLLVLLVSYLRSQIKKRDEYETKLTLIMEEMAGDDDELRQKFKRLLEGKKS